MLSIVRDEVRTVLISSHQLTDMERFADRVGVLHRGKLVAEGATAELVERHLLAEFESGQEQGWEQIAGLHVQEREGSRWRAVLDTLTCPLESLSRRGARDVRTQPLTLEELFLALTR
ncbi:MAG: hypothetical protein EOP84_15985 [Verrucomicrobiaceae bacterium]|nr:MAG: hypothetical protein EOP84_15985 [Verrucomicrobiaceae bacterium]